MLTVYTPGPRKRMMKAGAGAKAHTVGSAYATAKPPVAVCGLVLGKGFDAPLYQGGAPHDQAHEIGTIRAELQPLVQTELDARARQ